MKFPTISEQFLYCCANQDTRAMFRGLKRLLIKLPEKKQQYLFYRGFFIACAEGNGEVVEDILSDPFYNFTDLGIVYNGLYLALENNHIHIAQYALEHSKFDLAQHASEEPFFSLNMTLMLKLFRNTQITHTEAFDFIVNYIETYVKQKDGEDFNLFSYKDYRLFTEAWHKGNEVAIEFLINRYNITGEEVDIKRHLLTTKFNPAPQVAENLKTLMFINFEKPMLEAEIGQAQDNKSSGDSMIGADLEKNRRKNKI